MAQLIEDDAVADMGNLMRSKRNLDLYSGGVEVTEKECREYLKFVDEVLKKVRNLIVGQ